MTLIKKIEDLSPIKKKIEVILTSKHVAESLEEAYAKIQKKAKLKGFREGKVPRPVLEQYYREEAEKNAIEICVNKTYPESLKEAELKPVSYPEIKILQFDPTSKGGKGMSYEASFEVKPLITIADFKGLKLEEPKASVTDAEIDERLEMIRQRVAQVTPVGHQRGLQNGDLVTIDYAGFEGSKNFTKGTVKDYNAEIGKGALLADFEKEILSLKKGESKKINLTLPANFSDKTLAGKAVRYEVSIKEIRERKLPEMNDEFAKDLGAFKTLDEVKKKIRDDITHEKYNKKRVALREQVVEQLAKKHKFEVPEGMILMELEGMWQQFLGYLQQQGVNPETAGLKPEDFVKNNREAAVKRVQSFLIFDEIAKKEKIIVSSEEVELKIEEIAKQSNQSAVILKQQYKAKNLLPQLSESILAEKILDFVLGAVKVKG